MSPALRLLANLLCHAEHAASDSVPCLQRAFAGALDHRPIRHRIAERHA